MRGEVVYSLGENILAEAIGIRPEEEIDLVMNCVVVMFALMKGTDCT